jgi:hypothetical protein
MMSFRICRVSLCYGAGEKTYTICMADYAYRISFLLTPVLNSTSCSFEMTRFSLSAKKLQLIIISDSIKLLIEKIN